LQDNRTALAPVVVELLRAATEACPPGAAASLAGERVHGVPEAVLAKEAVYNAVGGAAYELHDYIEFGPWFRGTLLQVGRPPGGRLAARTPI
jgi:hypothetical protein